MESNIEQTVLNFMGSLPAQQGFLYSLEVINFTTQSSVFNPAQIFTHFMGT